MKICCLQGGQAYNWASKDKLRKQIYCLQMARESEYPGAALSFRFVTRRAVNGINSPAGWQTHGAYYSVLAKEQNTKRSSHILSLHDIQRKCESSAAEQRLNFHIRPTSSTLYSCLGQKHHIAKHPHTTEFP